MNLILSLALADLRKDWLQVLGNIAMIVGVVLPLLVILAVRNGISDNLMAELNSNPDLLRLETQGNDSITDAMLATVQRMPETAFVVEKTRSQSDYLRLRKIGAREVEDGLAMTTAPGDPLLDGLPIPGAGEVAISWALSDRMSLVAGDDVHLITDAPERPRQLLLSAKVVSVVPPERLTGRAVLAPVATLDLVEAFYEGYAIPDHDITVGADLGTRITQFEGLRVHANSIDQVPELARKLAVATNRSIRSEARQIALTTALLHNVTRAVGLIATVALIGLAAALIFAVWAQIGRKRRVIATLTLMGLPANRLVLFPVIQALVTMAVALGLSFLGYLGAAALAAHLFSDMAQGQVTALGLWDIAATLVGGGLLALLSTLLAVRAVLSVETATVLRETT